MTQTLQLGPLMLPYALLLALSAVAAGSFAGQGMGRRIGVDVEPLLWRLLLAGAIAARLAFVVQFHEAYLKAPLDILDLRDGGWTPLAGIAVVGASGLIVGIRRVALRKPLGAAAGIASVVWLLGTATLATLFDTSVSLPALRLQALTGASVVLTDFHGKPTVVNLWATWCPPCRREMPVLQAAQAERPDVNFVFLNQGEAAVQVQSYLNGQQLVFQNVLLDPRGEAATQLGHRALPATLFFDARGRLVDTRVGELSRATLAQRLAALSTPSGSP